MARILLVLLIFVSLYSCDQTSSPVEREEKQHGLDEEAQAPAYDITADEQSSQMDLSVRNVSVSTDATSKDGLEAITRAYGPMDRRWMR